MPVKGKPKTKRQIREAKKLEEELEKNRAEAGGKLGKKLEENKTTNPPPNPLNETIDYDQLIADGVPEHQGCRRESPSWIKS